MSASSPTPSGEQEQAKRRWPTGIITIILFLIVLVIAFLTLAGVLPNSLSKVIPFLGLPALFIILSSSLFPEVGKLISSFFPKSTPSPRASIEAASSNTTQIPQSKSCSLKKLPPGGSKGLLPRDAIVKEIYTELQGSDTNIIIVTGLVASGKTILAELIYRYAEEQRQGGKSSFSTQALWIELKTMSSIYDISKLIIGAVGKRLRNYELDIDEQIEKLLEILDEKRMLVVLDGFDTLLDWKTGDFRPECQGMAEWLKYMHRYPYQTKFLVMTRSRWSGIEGFPGTYIKMRNIPELEPDEAIKLLVQDQSIPESEEDKEGMKKAARECNCHPKALRLLGSYLHAEQTKISTLLADPKSYQVSMRNIASSLFDESYKEYLNDTELAKLLLGFAVFREPVKQNTAVTTAKTEAKIENQTVRNALAIMRRQNMLQPKGGELYELHPVVCIYIRDYSAQYDLDGLKDTHKKAAQHYLSMYDTSRLRREKERALVEAIWQYYQAEEYDEVYNLLRTEKIFDDLRQLEKPQALLDLLLLFEQSHLEKQKLAHIYFYQRRISHVLGKREQAQRYYEDTRNLSKGADDPILQGEVLDNMGILYCEDNHDKEALASFLIAKEYFEKGQDQSSHNGRVQNHIRLLREKIGNAQYEALLKEVEPHKNQIVEKALEEEIK